MNRTPARAIRLRLRPPVVRVLLRAIGHALLAALLWAGAGTAGAVAPEPASALAEHEDLYLEAMRAIAEGRHQDASEALSRMVVLEPQHAGAWLDLAIIQCELGRAAEAARLFDAILTRFAPPPEIRDVIVTTRARGCGGKQPDRKLALLIGRGTDTNVNQGASSPTFTFGFGSTAVEAQLLPDYLPRRDQFSVVQADYSSDLTPGGTLASLQFQARVNDRLKQYDAAALVVGLERAAHAGPFGVRGIGSLGLLTLGGKLYQTQALMQARISPDWITLLPAGWSWPQSLQLTLIPGLAHIAYPTLTNYDANATELRAQLTWRLPDAEITASAGHLADFAASRRPGGDRKGWSSTLRASTRIAGELFGELGWSRQTWQSSTSYSPGLIDTVRHQDTQVVRGTLILPVRERQSLQLELRSVNNRENISIFQYRSQQLQLSWQWQNQ
ncbi:MAG: tetratricopeptide repeat protein [Herminiimonas sp.]|nr:tetratricopeptide repeat protein [Herminiimonas sp.]